MKQWWERRTLRFRLALWYAVGGTVLLAGFSATLYVYVAERMARPLAYQLRNDLDEVRKNLEIQPDGTMQWKGAAVPSGAPWDEKDPWFELWDEQGKLVRRFWPYSENRVQTLSPPVHGRETLSVYYPTPAAPELQLRVLSVPFKPPGEPREWMIRMLRIHEPIAESLGALRLIIFVALPVVIALLVIGGYVITRRWLLPLDQMAAEADRITADHLDLRLPIANPHDELGRLAGVFNDTLDRLQESFDALDRFVADASHELRTPLTTLRSVGEVGLRRSRTVGEYREIIGSMLEEAQRLQLLIQRLLELASAEGGAADVQRSEIKVDEFVATCVAEISILAEYRNQQVSVSAVRCTIKTDAVLFRQALQNLVDNAIKYSPPQTTIEVAVRDLGAEVEVAVSDQGPGISPENRGHLMERFFRPDRARGRTSGGFGLGLSITKAYMRVLGGTLEYEPVVPHGSTFRLRLPKT
jgi:two-component system OmpR family sensor kinase